MNSNFSVERVPIQKKKDENGPQKFEKFPRLYLELIENKDKIKPNHVNKEYNAEEAMSVASDDYNIPKNKHEKKMTTINEDDDDDVSNNSSDDNYSVSNDDDDQSRDATDDKSSVESVSDDEDEESINDLEDDHNNIYNNNTASDETKDRLKAMLHAEDPPRLSDLQKNGIIHQERSIPNLNYAEDDDEDTENMKREMLFKFQLLKRSYPNVDIPNFTVHSSLKKMQESYDDTLRFLSLESSVDSYKNILVGTFMLSEYALSYLKFDMSGFTQQQILNMSSYEKLLIELGQRNYQPQGEQWPVEVRLVGLVFVNAVVFILSKMILQKTGSNLMGLMNNSMRQKMTNDFHSELNNPGNNVDTTFIPQRQDTVKPDERRRMRKPNFDFNSL